MHVELSQRRKVTNEQAAGMTQMLEGLHWKFDFGKVKIAIDAGKPLPKEASLVLQQAKDAQDKMIKEGTKLLTKIAPNDKFFNDVKKCIQASKIQTCRV